MKRFTNNRKRWEDHYTRRARAEKYPARSVYKLEEIQGRFGPIRKNNRVLDLGCAPGSWLLYAARLVGRNGQVTGIDRQPVTVRLPDTVRVVSADLLEPDEGLEALLAAGAFDVVLSDMAPATSGDRRTDAARSFYLCEAALDIARRVLVTGGNLVVKIFQGEDFERFTAAVSDAFSTRRIFKPRSSRSASREIFVIGLGLKPPHTGPGPS